MTQNPEALDWFVIQHWPNNRPYIVPTYAPHRRIASTLKVAHDLVTRAREGCVAGQGQYTYYVLHRSELSLFGVQLNGEGSSD